MSPLTPKTSWRTITTGAGEHAGIATYAENWPPSVGIVIDWFMLASDPPYVQITATSASHDGEM
jgi:hypothetical protein